MYGLIQSDSKLNENWGNFLGYEFVEMTETIVLTQVKPELHPRVPHLVSRKKNCK